MDILHLDMTNRKDNAREKNNRYIKMLSYLTLQKKYYTFFLQCYLHVLYKARMNRKR